MTRSTMCALAMALGLTLVGISCAKDEPTALKTPGTVRVNLTTPHSGLDGAAVVVLSGPATPRSVTPGAGLTLWGAPVETPQSRVALTGVLNAGTILTLEIEDIELASQYTATLHEVANGDSTVAIRSPLSEYSLVVVR
jgi:hypothetical protein